MVENRRRGGKKKAEFPIKPPYSAKKKVERRKRGPILAPQRRGTHPSGGADSPKKKKGKRSGDIRKEGGEDYPGNSGAVTRKRRTMPVVTRKKKKEDFNLKAPTRFRRSRKERKEYPGRTTGGVGGERRDPAAGGEGKKTHLPRDGTSKEGTSPGGGLPPPKEKGILTVLPHPWGERKGRKGEGEKKKGCRHITPAL